jgi:hypothetical protein
VIEGYGVYEETNDDFVRMEGLEKKVALRVGAVILEGWKECRILLDGCLDFIDVETAVKKMYYKRWR